MKVDAGACVRGLLIGVSAWLALGVTCTLVDRDSARTLGLLPSFWFLAAAVIAGMALMHAGRARRLPWALTTLALLTTAVAWLPLPAAPWIDAWSSRASLPIFVLIAATIVGSSVTPRGTWNSDRGAPWTAAAIASLWLIAVWFALKGRGISGDEPHYLLIAQSLLSDGDFDLRNNYDAGDFLAYYGGSLEPRHVSLGVLGQEYSFHGPGVSVLTLPAFALGGAPAARLCIALLVACSSGLLWSSIRRLTSSSDAAWVGWAAFVMSAPLSLNGTMIYPDGPGAVATIIGLWALIRAERNDLPPDWALALAGLALATLPWLHLRLALVAVCLGAGLFLVLARRHDGLSRIACLFAAPLVGATLLFASSWVMFGTLDPTSVFRQQAAGSLAAAPTGLIGMLFDQEYGLLPYAPCFALAPFGMALLWRRQPIVTATAGAIAAGTLLVSASWVWWGGQSAPARFLVPILPVLALGVGAMWTTTGLTIRSFIGVGLALAASLSALMATADEGAHAINAPDGRGSIFEWLCPSIDLSSALPSLFRSGATTRSEATVALIWVLVFVLASVAVYTLVRVRRATPLPLAAATSVVACSLASALVWSWRDVSPWTESRAELALLLAGGSRWLPTTLMVPGPGVVSRTELFSTVSISAPRSQPPSALLHVPMLPAGRYRIDVDPASPRALTLELGQNAWRFATWTADASTSRTFVTAFPTWAARVTMAEDDARPPRVRLQPLEVWPVHGGRGELAWRATPYGPLVVYSLDRSSYPEGGGLWLAANRESVLAIGDREGREHAARLHFEAGEAPVTITMTNDAGWRAELALGPGDRGRVETPAAATGRPRPLRFAVNGGFLAPDHRGLGVWLTVEAK